MCSSDSSQIKDTISLYFGYVTHIRVRPKYHKFKYRVFSIYADLELLQNISKKSLFFGFNKPSIFSFYDKDHGLRDGSSTVSWFKKILEQKGISSQGRIFISCYPRILGYVFNPITVYFYYNNLGDLKAILYEVKNTFGEQCCYFIKINSNEKRYNHRHKKEMIVSPFNSINHVYEFNLNTPEDIFFLNIDEFDSKGRILTAFFKGKKRRFSDFNLMLAFFMYPLMTIKIIAAIHYEALKLFIKGISVTPEIPKIKNKTVAFSIRLFLSIIRFVNIKKRN